MLLTALVVLCAADGGEPSPSITNGVIRTVGFIQSAKEYAAAQHGSGASNGFNREVDARGTWHAQVGQDRTLAKLFHHKRQGYFVDLASNEPIFLSNTRTLERDFGWRGLCIDGNFDLVLKVLRQRMCQPVHAVVTNHTGDTVRFTTPIKLKTAHDDIVASGYGGVVTDEGFVHDLHGRDRSGWKVDTHTTVSLIELLTHYAAPRVIDYLSLDVEGVEDAVFLDFDLSRFTFNAITIERPSAALRAKLHRGGYAYVGDHGCFGDTFWVHSSMVQQAEHALHVRVDMSSDGSTLDQWFGNCSIATGESKKELRGVESVFRRSGRPASATTGTAAVL